MWWLTDQARLRIEREAIEALDADWFQNPVWSVDEQLRLTLGFDILIVRGNYPLQLTYHNTFPASPPSIVPADGDARLSGHQYGAGGDLCLEIRNDNWTPDVTGAMMIESARRLLETEAPDDEGAPVHAPSAHDFPATLALRSEVTRFYIGPLARLLLADDNIDGLPLEIGIDSYSGRTFMAHILSICDQVNGLKQSLAPDALRKTCVVKEGVVFATDTPTTVLKKIKTFKNLVDGDILHIGNLQRHDGDWRDVGRHKVELTAHRLRLIRRDIEVDVWRSAIGAQVSSQEAANVNQALASCDVFIDATANPDVFNHLASLSLRHNRSFLWGAVYAGGVGGEMARARVNKDPSPYDIRTVINQYYEISDETPPVATGSGYDGSIGEAAPMQAADADVAVFAAHISAFALDTLSDTEPPNYDAHAYLVGLKRGWLFDGPFDARPIIVDAPVRSSLSPVSGAAVESDFIKSLFQGASGETADSENHD